MAPQPDSQLKASAAMAIENHCVSCRVAVRMSCPLEDYIEMT
jgi:hypothetical protein